MSINSLDSPDVLSFQTIAGNQNYVCPLGFLFQNKVYVIPQRIIVFDDNIKDFETLFLRSEYQAAGNWGKKEFNFKLNTFLISDNKVYKKVVIPFETKRKFACIGCYKKTWYICSTVHDFDRFRKCIIENDDTHWEKILVPESEIAIEIVSWLKTKLKEHEHAVVICTQNGDVMAFSVLYGKSYGLFKLGKGYFKDNFSYAVICDFENAMETWYDLEVPIIG